MAAELTALLVQTLAILLLIFQTNLLREVAIEVSSRLPLYSIHGRPLQLLPIALLFVRYSFSCDCVHRGAFAFWAMTGYRSVQQVYYCGLCYHGGCAFPW